MTFWPIVKKDYPSEWIVDVHSHLVPGVDDGVKSVEEAVEIIQFLSQRGIRRIITTPHIYPDVYPNTENQLIKAFEQVRSRIDSLGLDVEIELAAEYFMHAELLKKLENNRPLLGFGKDRNILLETAFQDQPRIWEHVIFELIVKGYKPVIAHPERYNYVAENPEVVRGWREQGIKTQINIPSILGAYGSKVRATAQMLIKKGWVDMIGSDIHRLDQISLLEKVKTSKLFYQASLLAGNSNLL